DRSVADTAERHVVKGQPPRWSGRLRARSRRAVTARTIAADEAALADAATGAAGAAAVDVGLTARCNAVETRGREAVAERHRDVVRDARDDLGRGHRRERAPAWVEAI